MARAARTAPAPAPGFRTIDGQSDVFFDDEPAAAAPAPVRRARGTYPPRVADRQDSSAIAFDFGAAAAVDSAFNALAQTVLVQNARTLEDLVREMLRPCSSPGSTTTCRAWSSGWSGPRSSASRAGAIEPDNSVVFG